MSDPRSKRERFKSWIGRPKSPGRSSSPASTSSHSNSHSAAPDLLTKLSSHSLRTNASVNDATVSQSSENLSNCHSLSLPLTVQSFVSPSPDQSLTSSPPPAIKISPSVPITKAAPVTIPTEDTSKTPAPPLNIWKEVFEKVNNETKRWISDHGLDSTEKLQPEGQIEGLITLLKSKTLAEEKDTPSKIVIGTHEITLRDYVPRIVASLTMVGDAVITFAPPQASAPWAAARALLQIPVKGVEQKVALVGTIQWFTRVVRRGQLYELLYNETTTDKQVLLNLHDALRDLYIAAIELLARSDVLFKSGKITQTLNAILRPEQVSGLVSDLANKEQRLMLEVQPCEASRSAKTGMQLNQNIHDMLKMLDEMSAPLRRIDEGIAKLLGDMNQNRLRKLMNFISSKQSGKGHSDFSEARIENSGNWLISHERFCAWQAGEYTSVFCLQGNVGTGKTYLTSRVIDHVKEVLKTSVHNEGFAFFYCSKAGSSRQDPIVALRSFVRQLCYRDDYDCVQKSVIQTCQEAEKENRGLSYKECRELILELLSLYSKTTIILDALDETNTDENNLAQTLVDLAAMATKPVKVFVSSRPGRRYLGAFEAKSTITISSDDQQVDIGKFLDEKLYSTPSFQSRQKNIRDLIRKTFTSRNGGMFRWVELQVNRVIPIVSNDAIRVWADKIPQNLEAAYDQMWDTLKKDRECEMPLIERAIKWVLCSIRPLETEELLAAIRYTIEYDTLVQKEQHTHQEILLLCRDFLTIDTEKQVWMLPHISVAEYFESNNDILGNCDVFASNIKLNILMAPDEDVFVMKSNELVLFTESGENVPEYPDPSSGRRPFKEYFTADWPEHVQRYDRWLGSTKGATPDAQLVTFLKQFLGSPEDSSAYYRKWVGPLEDETLLDSGLHPSNISWLAMCRYGFYYVLQDWWDHNIDKNSHLQCLITRRYDALSLAAKGGCVVVCRRLLSTMDMNDSVQLGPAMDNAILGGHKDVISLLVTQGKFGIDLYLRDKPRVVLHATRHPGLLQWLVSRGWFNVNKGFSLLLAATTGRFEAVEDIIRAGADVNLTANVATRFGSALAAAVTASQPNGELDPNRMKTINILLEKGADPNLPLRAGRCGSALETVMVFYRPPRHPPEVMAEYGLSQPKEVLAILLKAGADPAMLLNHGDHGSALAAAAFHGLKDMLIMMVKVTKEDRAIQCLGQSRHPKEISINDFETWKQSRQDTIAYLTDQVGADKKTLHKIGLWQISPEEVGTFDGTYFRYWPGQTPDIQKPAIKEPIIREPIIQEPTIQQPTIQQPIIEELIIEEPTIQEPIVQEPIIQEPIIQEPIIQEPIIREPIIQEPTIQQPIIYTRIVAPQDVMPSDLLYTFY